MAMLLDFFVKRYLGKLADFAEEEASKILCVRREIKRFRRRLERIQDFLQDAEQRRHGDANINNWVKELKDLMYDADDIIDDCIMEGSELLMEEGQPSDSNSGVCFPLDLLSDCFEYTKYRYEISSRIQTLNGRLKEIVEDRSTLPRLQHSSHGLLVDTRKRPVSLEVKSDIVGEEIEAAARNLIKQIMQNDDKQNCEVFGIVGIGGIGKTTLARKIYNDERIKESFPIRIWLHVSKNYSDDDLLKEIIQGAGGNVEIGESKDRLVNKLVTLVSQNLFVVLDDVWREDVWLDLLRDPIKCGVASSKNILVTTRDEKVVRSMRASYIHHVQKMNTETGWALLRKIVFGDDHEAELHEIERFTETGIKIVEKCDGLPLAIKVIGGVLISKERNTSVWEDVLRSGLWSMNRIEEEELPRALYLSYQDLPSHLKQCFLYCCLNPTNVSVNLVQHWVAQDFIIIEQGRNKLMEETAHDYYKELVWRNLLQLDPIYPDETQFSMHDLLRSLGAKLMEGEGVSLNNSTDGRQTLDYNNYLTKIRWLSMSNKEETLTLPDIIRKQKCLRVLVLFDSLQTKTIHGDVLQSLRRVRVLHLSRTSIESLPDAIGELLHLRYLDLSFTNIRQIPESIGGLANLQTLDAGCCKYLRGVPKGITRLHNLRCLLLHASPLTHTPKGIGRLKNINQLQGFVVGHDDGEANEEQYCDLEELQSLSDLRTLIIHRMERAREGASAALSKPKLRRLYLGWTEEPLTPYSQADIQKAEKILDGVSPRSSLQDLAIYGFPGRRPPTWMMSATGSGHSSFPDLAILKFFNLPSCTELPPLGQLPGLKFLQVKGAEAIKTIGPQLLGPDFPRAPAFPELEYIQFTGMPNWEEWLWCMEEDVVQVDDDADAGGRRRKRQQLLPNLKTCILQECPKLKALPDALRHATKLKDLIIRAAHNLRKIDHLPLTEVLQVTFMKSLERICNLPELRSLQIKLCPSLVQVENLDKLEHLFLQCSPWEEDLPEWLPGLVEQHRDASSTSTSSFIEKFELYGESALVNRLMEGANSHIIERIPQVILHTRTHTYVKQL